MMLTKASDKWTLGEAAHLLNRAGFGGSPREVNRLHGMGRKKAVEWLLNTREVTDAWPPPEWARDEELAFGEMRKGFVANREAMRGLEPEEREKKRRELNQQRQRARRQQGVSLQGWWFERMVKSKAPLREKMTLFWHDHFPTSLKKVKLPILLYKQNALFRDHAVGNFKKLTHKIAIDPAMMLYLDTPTSKKGMPNENFAREVLELFTLGEGHYGEKDIKEAARAFTGYSLNRGTGAVTHNRSRWDRGEKTFLGKTGKFDGDGIIDVIFAGKQVTRYLSMKLWEFFAYENPSEGLVEALGGVLAAENFEVKPLLRTIFRSEEFYSEQAVRTQIKSPVQYLAQMFRQLEIAELPDTYLAAVQVQLGQVLFLPPNVAGWDWGKAWINTNSLLTRYNVAGLITKGTSAEAMTTGMGGGKGKGGGMQMQRAMQRASRSFAGPDYEEIVPREVRGDTRELVKTLSFRLFQTQLDEKQAKTFREYADAKRGVVFTNTEVAELVHLMMSTPYYQLT